MEELDLEGFEKYLQEINFRSVSNYKSYINMLLKILDSIEEFNTLPTVERIIIFAKKNNDFKETFDSYHSFASSDTFNDLRSGARKYILFLHYKKILKSIEKYKENPNIFPIHDAYWFMKFIENNHAYPIKAIYRDTLEAQEIFTTDEAKSELKKIFGKNNIEFIDTRNQNDTQHINIQNELNLICTKNIILYGPPGVGKTYNHKKLISLIEEGRNQKEIFDGIRKNDIEHDETLFEPIKSENRFKFVTFHQSYSYEDFIEGFRPNEDGGIGLEDGIFKQIAQEARNNLQKNFYLLIDEINRGNISKIFGELITLIEDDKRDEIEVTLPYSKEPFKVPSNLYIIATMNSTDKSIALIDVALRRRFTFLKMKPDESLVDDEALDIFRKLNEIIKNKLGEDYQIGHSYFMDSDLDFVLEYKIKPLLEEYFYGDEDGLKEALEIIEPSS